MMCINAFQNSGVVLQYPSVAPTTTTVEPAPPHHNQSTSIPQGQYQLTSAPNIGFEHQRPPPTAPSADLVQPPAYEEVVSDNMPPEKY